MGIAVDALMTVRAQLCDRIDRIAIELPHLSLDQLCNQIDEIRRTAREYGLTPLAELARGLECAMGEETSGAMVLPFLDTMRDAAGCERVDEEATRSYLAAVSIRRHS